MKRYVELLYPSYRKKEGLINVILLHYGLYDLVIARDLRASSPVIVIQKMKALYRTGRAAECEALFWKNEQRFKRNSDRKLALHFHASALYQLSNFALSLSVAKEQLVLAKKDGADIVPALNNLGGGGGDGVVGLGDVAQMDEDYRGAYEFYKKARAVYVQLGHSYNLAYIDLNMGVALTGIGRYKHAERQLRQAELSFRNPYNQQGLIFVLNALSKLYYRRQDYKESSTSITEAMQIVERFPRLPIASEVAAVFVAVVHRQFNATEIPPRLKWLIEAVSTSRKDQWAKVLQRILEDGMKRKHLLVIERNLLA